MLRQEKDLSSAIENTMISLFETLIYHGVKNPTIKLMLNREIVASLIAEQYRMYQTLTPPSSTANPFATLNLPSVGFCQAFVIEDFVTISKDKFLLMRRLFNLVLNMSSCLDKRKLATFDSLRSEELLDILNAQVKEIVGVIKSIEEGIKDEEVVF